MFWSFLLSRKILRLINCLTFKLQSTFNTINSSSFLYHKRDQNGENKTSQNSQYFYQNFSYISFVYFNQQRLSQMDQQQNGAQFFKQQISTMTRIESFSKKRGSQTKKDMFNYNYAYRQYQKNQQYQATEPSKQPYRRPNYYKNNPQYSQKCFESNNHCIQNNQKYNFSKGTGRERRFDHQYNNAYPNYDSECSSYPNNTLRAQQKRDNNKRIRYKQKVVLNQKEVQVINTKPTQQKEACSLKNDSNINYEQADIPNEQKFQKEEVLTDSKSESITYTDQIDISQPQEQCLQMKINLNPTKKLIKSKKEKQFIKEEQIHKNSQISISKSWQIDYEASVTQNMDLNLSRQANQLLQFFDNWQKFQDYPLKSVWINFQTNSFINQVKILSLFIIPMKQELKLQNYPSRFYEPKNNKFQFRKKQYRENEVVSEICKMRIPSTKNHELNDIILREMVEVKSVRVKCSNCQSRNVIQFKHNRNSGTSCKKCSGVMEISIISLTLYQPK